MGFEMKKFKKENIFLHLKFNLSLVISGYWLNNKRHGFGCLFLKDGRKVEGKWRSNKLVTPIDRKKGARNILQHGTAKRIEKVERAIIDAKHAAELAKKKAEITLSRLETLLNDML